MDAGVDGGDDRLRRRSIGALVGQRARSSSAVLPVAAGDQPCSSHAYPFAGYVAVLWSVGTAIDMIALPEVGVSSLRSSPPKSCSGSQSEASCSCPATLRRELISLAVRRESLVVALFLARDRRLAWPSGVENGASVHTAVLDMRLMLFYAAFWPALVALTSAGDWSSRWSRLVSWRS